MTEVSPVQAEELVRASKAVLVDVREKGETESGMAAPALWFPTSQIDPDDAGWKKFLTSLPKDKTVILYCASGMRSAGVAEYLADQGYTTANMGGFSSWKSAGFPVRMP